MVILTAMRKELRPLKDYLTPMTVEQREKLAVDCDVAAGHLRNVAHGSRSCSVELAIALERITKGVLRCEELCPDLDWKYLRTRGASRSTDGHAI